MNDTTTTTTTEQAADLAALQAAASADPGALSARPQAEAPPGPDLATEIAGLVAVAVATLGPVFPSLRATYTEETTRAAAEAVARVCVKHGWATNGLMGKWGEEIACAAIVGPLAWQTYAGIKADLEARQPAKPAQAIAGPDLSAPTPVPAAPTSKTVSFAAS
jgi:hypothetical protein